MYIPSATYRVQLHKGFNFSRLSRILPYLYELGISTVYASPVTRAIAGSEHGYDVINPLEINPEIGTAEEWESISGFLKSHGMGWIQDIVPNHMAYSPENELIFDMMERGKDSDFDSFFDVIPQFIGASPSSTRIMVPFLGRDLSDCLRDAEIKLVFQSGGFFFQYGEQFYPVAISTYHWICSVVPVFFQPLLTWSDKTASFSLLPWPEWKHFKVRLMAEVFGHARLRALADEYCAFINQDPDLLQQLLSFQHYELCGWKKSFSVMNYRRFFAVNSLICLRMEDEAVFTYWHQLLLSLYKQGLIQGFRVDHIDGLFDPRGYLQNWREAVGPEAYIISEKILQENEETLADWPVQGTTGYDFLCFANQLLLEHAGKQKLAAYFKTHYNGQGYADMVYDKKRDFLRSHLNGELNNLMRWLQPLLLIQGIRFDRETIKQALATLMAAFPVYRIYAVQLPLSGTDRQWLDQAFNKAFEKEPLLQEALRQLQSLFNTNREDPSAADVLYFLQRWSQFTAPLAAKGTEDTVFYNYNVLMGLNEVGDSPGHSPVTAAVFHEIMENRQKKASLSLNASSTHDTKRGEDNRLRINLISLYADEWIVLVEKWKIINQPFIQKNDTGRSPSANDEYVIYQTLAGAIPAEGLPGPEFEKRFTACLVKALREEKRETNWETPDTAYETICLHFVKSILSPDHDFLSAFMPFIKKLTEQAAIFTLSGTLLKLTAPGIPDIYQGAELWDLSLVDPDNRRPVDFDQRMIMLDSIIAGEEDDSVLEFVSRNRAAGAQKLFLIRKILQFRRNNAGLFSKGQYIPVIANPGWLGYIRKQEGQQLLILVPLPSEESTPCIPEITGIRGRWKNLFTNGMVDLQDSIDTLELLKEFPVAALILQND